MNWEQKMNPMQTEAMKHQFGPLLILAGAGSGKTRVITNRIAYLIEEYNVSPYNILAITFTNKAAKEMRERVNALVEYGAENVWVSTFHSTCVRMLRRFGNTLGYSDNFSIYDTDDQKSLIRSICKKFNIDSKKYREKFFLNHISKAKNELIGPDCYRPIGSTNNETDMISKVYHEYQAQLQANNAMDFDDLLMNCVEMFRRSEDALNYYRNRFRYIMVDEYQDTNVAQFEFVRLLAHYVNDEGAVECNLCVVGDDDQSIYGFRGADISNILNFEKYYPNAKVIKLEQNYRSTETILDAANTIIKNNFHTVDKRLWTNLGKGDPIQYTVYPSDMEEAAGIVDIIREQVDNGKATYSDFAILYRTNAQSRAFETQLNKHRIPNKVVGNINFYQRKEVKDILGYLKTIDNGLDALAVRRVLNVPKRGIGDTTMERVQAFADNNDCSFYDALTYADHIPSLTRAAAKIHSFVAIIESYRKRFATAGPSVSLKDIVEELLNEIDYYNELHDEDPDSYDDRLGNISELFNAMAYYEETCDGEPSLSGYLAEIALVSDLDAVEEHPEYVVLMTIHSAKGLEFEQVFLAGMEENLFPSSMSIESDERDANNYDKGVEEERRLCYVGITRAMRRLYMSRASRRYVHGEEQCNGESRFMKELKKNGRHLLIEKNAANDYFGDSFRDSFRRSSGYSRHEREESNYSPSFRRAESSDFGNGGFSLEDLLNSKKPATKPYDNPYRAKTVPVAKSIGSGSASSLGYQVGDRVSHSKFGIGTVTNIIKGGKDFEVTVDFPSGTKKMLATFAKLQKV